MENLTHSLTGAVLARTGLAQKVPYGTTSLIIAANLPDIDSVVGFWGRLYYLHYHRGITHSIPGAILLGFLFAGLLWLLNKRKKEPVPSSFGTILGVVYLVLATHPLLDYTNSYGWRPWLPFNDEWIYGDTVFIVDPYLWILLGSALFLTARRTRLSRVVWVVGIAATSYLIVRFALPLSGGHWLAFIWFAALAAVLLTRWWRPVVYGRWLAYASLLGFFLYWGLLFVNHHRALDLAFQLISTDFPILERTDLSATPRAINPFSWDILFEDAEKVYYGRLVLPAGLNPGIESYPKNLDQPAVQATLDTCPGYVMTYWSRFEFFEVSHEDESPIVIIRDARYTREASSGFGAMQIPLTHDLQHDLVEWPCPRVF